MTSIAQRLSIALAVLGGIVGPASAVSGQESCPLASNDVVSAAVGTPMEVLPFPGAVSRLGALTSCLFSAASAGDIGGATITMIESGAQPGSEASLSQLTLDSLFGGSVAWNYAPVDGIGDAASWATVQDANLAAENMSFLVVRRGANVFTFSTDDLDADRARSSAVKLARSVLAGLP